MSASYQVPGSVYVAQTTSTQRQVPGGVYMVQTQPAPQYAAVFVKQAVNRASTY